MFGVCGLCFCYFFFFEQKTAYEMRISDWSSDVCSSDLPRVRPEIGDRLGLLLEHQHPVAVLERGARAIGLVIIIEGLGRGGERAAKIGRASRRDRVCQYV